MTPEERREWRRRVFSSGPDDLTMAQKVVLLALETFADYGTGANARPGESTLAEMCRLTPRAVRAALAQGQRLGLIERTSPANPKRGLAAVYRLATTGTAVPVETLATTGTAVPVEAPNSGTAMHQYRNGHDTTTGTAVPPTVPRPFQDREARAPDADAETFKPPPHLNGSTPRTFEEPANSNAAHAPRCVRHRHIINDRDVPRCPDCRDERVADETRRQLLRAEAAEAEAKAARDCTRCDEGWLLGPDRLPLEPAIRCNHLEQIA